MLRACTKTLSVRAIVSKGRCNSSAEGHEGHLPTESDIAVVHGQPTGAASQDSDIFRVEWETKEVTVAGKTGLVSIRSSEVLPPCIWLVRSVIDLGLGLGSMTRDCDLIVFQD